MALPLFTLGNPFVTLVTPCEVLWQGAHKKASSAVDRHYQINERRIILTEWRGCLHCVICQTPLDDDIAIESRNAALFEHYGEGRDWREVLDNGFGKTYRRPDTARFGLWSYAMDFNTFGTMEFHEVMWG